jgi:hypothetical protein
MGVSLNDDTLSGGAYATWRGRSGESRLKKRHGRRYNAEL